MSSLAEFIPIELVNHILSFRPRHPVACLIKELKENIFRKADLTMKIYSYKPYFYNETFKVINNMLIKYHNFNIFSSCIRPNSIYKIKTKRYKNSEGFYWEEKYYTEKKAKEDLEEAKGYSYCDAIYSIELINIDNDSLDEHIVETIFIDGSDEEYDSDNSDDGYEEEEEFKQSDSESEDSMGS